MAQKSINELISKFAAKAKDLGGISDPVGEARFLLNTKNNKYGPDESGEVKLPDGRLAKLITVQEASASGLKHRLYIQCKFCEKWIPAGRLHQHEPSCLLKNDPVQYHSKQDLKKKFEELRKYIISCTTPQERIDGNKIMLDLLEESGDPRYKLYMNNARNDIKYWQAFMVARDKFDGQYTPNTKRRIEDGVEVRIRDEDGLPDVFYSVTVDDHGSPTTKRMTQNHDGSLSPWIGENHYSNII